MTIVKVLFLYLAINYVRSLENNYESDAGKTIEHKEEKQWLAASNNNSSSQNMAMKIDDKYETLLDEDSNGLFVGILESAREHVNKVELLPIFSVVLSIVFIAAAGYLMSYLMKLEEQSIQTGLNGSREGNKRRKSSQGNRKADQSELRIHELRAELYNGLVRLLKPGCRTIVLLADRESVSKLLPKFYKAVWPYRRNKSLQFAFVHLEKGLYWYRELLTLALSDDEQREPLNINPRNCIGTVLSISGYRKYFCIHHKKHPERITSKLEKYNKNSSTWFDSSSDSDVESYNREKVEEFGSTVLLEEHLLDDLSNWLECLFEGSTHRYYVNYWPDFPIK